MIVETADLPRYRGAVAMVDGGFDPLHPGHVDYFRAASEFGVPVLCNVSPDTWVSRKHAPLLSQEDRAAVIDAIRYVSYTHLSSGTTAEVLELLQPKYHVKGDDWRDRLPEDEVELCRRYGIEIVFADTVSRSSSAILERYRSAEVAT